MRLNDTICQPQGGHQQIPLKRGIFLNYALQNQICTAEYTKQTKEAEMTPQKNQCLKNWQPTTKPRRVATEIAAAVIKRHAMTAILLAGMIALSSEFFAK